MAVELPLLGLVDIRQPIIGDSFGWAGLEPTAAKKSVVFHHSASDQPAEDGFSIADYHVNGPNKWGGIGYHFVITRSDYPGRAPFTSPGAQIQYVGDLGTWRAHVANQNPGRVGVCFVGMAPDQEQLKLGRQLMEYLVAPNNILPSINFMNQATVHRLVPEQSTACPGDEYTTWLPYLQGGAWPYEVPAPEPAPVVAPDPTPEPGKGGGIPEYEATYRTAPETRAIQREGAYAVNVITGQNVTEAIPVGTSVQIAGYFSAGGTDYVRTVFSATHTPPLWNGVPAQFFDAPVTESNGMPNGDVPIKVGPGLGPNPVVLPDSTLSPVTRQATIWEKLVDLASSIFALILKTKKKGA